MALFSALLVAFVLAFLCCRYVLYPAFLSPLSKIPTAHRTASILPVWFWWKGRNNCQARSLLDAHRRKGPIIRIEPNHIHLASQDALRVVWGTGNFNRTSWTDQFRNYDGTPNLLTMLDSKQHAARRRIVSPVYSKSYILGSLEFQSLSHILLFDRLLPIFAQAAETGQSVDMFDQSYAIGADFTSAYLYGTGFGFDLISNKREREAYLDISRIKVLELKGREEVAKILEDLNLEMCGKAEEFLTSTEESYDDKKLESASTYPVVYASLRKSIPLQEGPKTPEQIRYLVASELLDHLEAGRVGIGGALIYILHELSRRPDTQSALREELKTLHPLLCHPQGQNRISASTLQMLDGLPLLDAVVMETLRLRNPILTPSRRVVPRSGAVIEGFFIPAGTVVSSSPYTLNRNPDAFPDPEEWKPQRWIGLSDAAGNRRGAEKGRESNNPRAWFWTFISGNRMCVGKDFAITVMKLVIAGIYTNFAAEIIDDEGIEQLDRMIATPAGEKLVLRVERLP